MAILCWAAKNSLHGTNVLIGPLRGELRLFRVVLIKTRRNEKNFQDSNLLAQTSHAVALCQRMRLQIASVDSAYRSICQRMRCMRQQIATIDGTYGNNLLAYTAHAVAKPCKIVCFASVDGAYDSKLQAYAVHVVALCWRRRRIRQQFASVDGTCCS